MATERSPGHANHSVNRRANLVFHRCNDFAIKISDNGAEIAWSMLMSAYPRSVFTLIVAVVFAHWALIPTAGAHSGHGKSEAPPTRMAEAAPRVDTQSAQFQLVASARNGTLVIYLDRTDSNAPVVGATVEVMAGESSVLASDQGAGVYHLAADWLRTAGSHDLVFTITSGDQSDLLIGSLHLPVRQQHSGQQPSGQQPSGQQPSATSHALTLPRDKLVLASSLAAFCLGLVVAAMVTRRKP